VEEHKKLGERVAKIVAVLLTVGLRARGIAEGAQNAGMNSNLIFQYEDSREAGRELQNILKKGDLVLVKGSQGARMERVVEEIMAHPEEKEKLLVRQDSEWRSRS
jgi:UDP-N-acetylmuramyl pentapeptide synthase